MEISKDEIPVCVSIIRLAKKQEYGEINLNLTVHKGKIANITSTSFEISKFKEGENANATAEIVSMIKNIFKNKQSGNITFSLSYRNGQIKQLTTQFTEKKTFQGVEKSNTI